MSTAPGELAPVRGRERILALDVVRGVAILGILLVNAKVFSSGFAFSAPSEPVPDPTANVLIWWFAEGKFISTLAFLFGLGFTFQAMRAESRERSATGLLLRRAGVLGLFGVVHTVFIWSGDILLTYAVMAVGLLLFHRCRPRTMLTWAGVLLGLGLLLVIATAAVLAVVGLPDAATGVVPLEEQARRAYTSGSYSEMVAQRRRELTFLPYSLLFTGFVFPMMLAGAAVARAGWLADLRAHGPALRRAAVAGFTLGLPLNAAYAAGSLLDPAGPGALAAVACWTVGAPALAIAYMAGATLLALEHPDHPLVRRLAAVGRLALTNYLLQSVVMTAIFYGLRLFGRLSLPASLGIALLVVAAQLALSARYLDRFATGPAEWLWRRLTYLRT
jgi:uncharacterized protein